MQPFSLFLQTNTCSNPSHLRFQGCGHIIVYTPLQCFAQLTSQGGSQRRGNGIPHLPMFIVNSSSEPMPVGEALRSSAFAHRHNSVLLGMENLTHLAHRLRVGG
jgi:hypothetical protein